MLLANYTNAFIEPWDRTKYTTLRPEYRSNIPLLLLNSVVSMLSIPYWGESVNEANYYSHKLYLIKVDQLSEIGTLTIMGLQTILNMLCLVINVYTPDSLRLPRKAMLT